MATREQLETALRNADAAGDVQAATALANALKAGEFNQPQQVSQELPIQEPSPQVVEPPKEKSLLDIFTGESRKTPEMDRLPELQESGLLAGEDTAKALGISQVLTTTTDPNEIASIISANFPNVGVAYNLDAEGNPYPILRNNETGAVAQVNKPGLSGLDVLQGLGIASAYMPTGRVGAGLGVVGRSAAQAGVTGATTSAIEGVQEAVGGDFNVSNVIIDMLSAGAVEAVPSFLQAWKGRKATQAEDALTEAAQAEADRVGSALSPEMAAQKQAQLAEDLVSASTSKKSEPSIRSVAESVAPDEDILQAAKELGIEESLIPSQYSRSQAYRELEGGLASIPGSQLSVQQKDSISKLSQKADDLILEFGGSIDKSALSMRLKDDLLKNIDGLSSEAEDVYKSIADGIPKQAKVNADAIYNELSQDVADLGGEEFLDGVEKRILQIAKSEDGPSYALIDKERRKIGQALNKASGPYKDADSGSLKRLYSLLTEAQESSAKEHGMDSLWDTAKTLVKQRKALEDSSIKLLGRDLTGAIMPKVGGAVKKLSSGDYKNFDEVMNSLPKSEQSEVVLSALNDAFTMGSRKEKSLSIPGFVDWMEGLNRNKSAKARIYNRLPKEARSRLDNIFTVAKGMRKASEEKITTGRIVALLDNFADEGGLISKLYQTGKRVAAAEGATSAAGIPGAGTAGVIVSTMSEGTKTPVKEAADKLLSSPEFAAAIRAYADTSAKAKAKQAAADAALLKSKKVSAWVDALPAEEAAEVARLGLVTYLSGEE